MSTTNHIRLASFTVIPGGKDPTAGRLHAPAAQRGDVPAEQLTEVPARARAPGMGAEELATEMARILSLTLLRDIPFAELSDPQRGVWIDAATRFTLHDLKSLLRRIQWPSRHMSLPSGDGSLLDLLSLSVPGDADHRVPSSKRRDDQPFVAQADGPRSDAILSTFLAVAPPRAAGPSGSALGVPGVADPGAAQPMSHWLRWIEAACGARLPFPGRADSARRDIRTPRELALQVHRRHACQPYFAAALLILARGTPLDPGLPRTPLGTSLWNGPRALDLMLRGVRRAEVHGPRADRRPRAARPGVVAARWSLMQSGEDLRAGPDALLEQAALNRVKTAAPRLLDWVARMNRAAGTGGFAMPTPDGGACDGWTPLDFHQNLMLPSVDRGADRFCPSLGAGQAVLAGTMVTLLKALFAPPNSEPNDEADGEPKGAARGIGVELDRLAANMTSARTIAGGFYDAENREGLRYGQSLALTLLREQLESDGQVAGLELRDFDGRRIALRARRNAPGSVRVVLSVDGAYAPWPDVGDIPEAYLTAVV